MANLPQTAARLAYSIKLFLIKTSTLTPEVLLNSTLSLGDISPIFITGVEKFHESEDRETEERYETDGDKSGDVISRIPRIVRKRISIDRAVLYTDDVSEFFNISPNKDLVDQTIPFALLKIEKAPKDSGIADRATLYLDCFLHNLPQTYELSRDLKMMQSINLGYRNKQVVGTTN